MQSRSIGTICLALFLIGYGIAQFTTIAVAPVVLAVLAVVAGILLLFGR